MAESKMALEFLEKVISDPSELKTSNKNIVEHLQKLNGSVARRESNLCRSMNTGALMSRNSAGGKRIESGSCGDSLAVSLFVRYGCWDLD